MTAVEPRCCLSAAQASCWGLLALPPGQWWSWSPCDDNHGRREAAAVETSCLGRGEKKASTGRELGRSSLGHHAELSVEMSL